MPANTKLKTDIDPNTTLQISRVFDAPRALVWKVWTDPVHMMHWFCAGGFKTLSVNVDLRVGGEYCFSMMSPSGSTHTAGGTYQEIKAPERLVYSHIWVKSCTPGAPKEGRNTTVTVDFIEQGDKTLVNFMHEGLDGYPDVESHRGGWTGFLENLAGYVDGRTEVGAEELVITRTFNAPRDLVWKVWTEQEHLAHWWGPKGATMKHAALDLKPGGSFHYCMDHAGMEMWGKFIYRDIKSPERLVFTSGFSDKDGNIVAAPFPGMEDKFPRQVLNIWTFEERDGKTIATGRGMPIDATQKERDFFKDMNASMQAGNKGMLDQLEEYIASLA
ncbi:MAG TPA: SRPBCC domain-containing protein [Alphaproteobacteria bacterium]